MCKHCEDTARIPALDTLHSVALPAGTISAAGQSAIETTLAAMDLESLPDDWAWRAKVGGKGEFVGSFAKRLAKFYHQKGRNLDSDFLGTIGSLVSQYSAKQSTYTIDYTNTFDWHGGDFGDDGVCFLDRGCRAAAPGKIREAGGRAVRFYNDGRGCARAWMVPRGDNWVVFNGYGLHVAEIAQVVAADMGASYKRVRLSNNGEDCGLIWINGGMGYLVGSAESVDYNQHIDLEIETGPGDDQTRCEDCGQYVDDDEIHNVNGDRAVCDSCYSDNYSWCEHCENDVSNDDMTEVNGQYYCNDCRGEYCERCEHCREWYIREDMTEVNGGEFVCENCLSVNYNYCENCNEYFPCNDTLEIDGECYCEDCANEFPICADCGERCKDTTTIDGRAVGNCCLDNYEFSEEFGTYGQRGQLCLA